MSLRKLSKNSKYVYTTQLYPKRTFSYEDGETVGDVYVFPNRSDNQKDNIDGRPLGTNPEDTEIIRPFSGDSLEQRRIDIYSGEFTYLTAGAFVESEPPEEWTYTPPQGLHPNDYPENVSDNDQFIASTISGLSETFTVFSQSGIPVHLRDTKSQIHSFLPEYPKNRTNINYEPALALLLDGANPLAEDHAWRFGLDPNQPATWPAGILTVNDSAAGFQTGEGVFTGYKVEFDDDGYPYQTKLITDKSELDPWPPEIKKWGTSVNSNYLVKGYSDYSMHPRNATKKKIEMYRSNHDYFSKGSVRARTVYNTLRKSVLGDQDWTVDNAQCFTMQDYVDNLGNRVYPKFSFPSTTNGYYSVDENSSWTMKMWIKPTERQTLEGTIVHYPGCYAVSLIPNNETEVQGIPQSFSIGLFLGTQSTVPSLGGTPTVQTDSLLLLEKWHEVIIRYSPLYNNGRLDIFIDDILVTSETGLVNLSYNRFVNISDLFIGTSSGYRHNASTDTGTPYFRFYSELGHLCCYNKALTQSEMQQEKSSQTTVRSDYLFYFSFQFDPTSTDILTVVPNSGEENLDLFQKNADFSVQNIQGQTQYNVNMGHNSSMPIILTLNHIEEKAQNQHPTHFGFGTQGANINNFDNVDFYPEIQGMTPSTHGLQYFINHWRSLSWLKAWNNYLVPSTCPWKPNKEWISNEYSSDTVDAKGRIKYYGNSIGKNEPYSLGHFLDDEIYQSLEELNNNGVDANDSTTFQRSDYLTEALWDNLQDQDFLPPFSTIVNIPNIFFGSNIKEGSVKLYCSRTGDDRLVISDEHGTMYLTNGSNKAKVGVIDYVTGMIVIFHPLLAHISTNNWSIEFNGMKKLFIKQYDITMDKNVGTVSSNPTYQELKPSSNSHDNESGVSMVSNIYLHDNNLNVIGKVNLASPIVKRKNDNFLFRVKLDF